MLDGADYVSTKKQVKRVERIFSGARERFLCQSFARWLDAALARDRLAPLMELLPCHATLPLKPPPHALVSEIDRIAEHQRTASNDTVKTLRVALLNGRL
jgi:hypothetical protein